jgi:hypothetical protein
MENETSMMIWAPHAFGILLGIWKISQATRAERREHFPYFALIDKASYT